MIHKKLLYWLISLSLLILACFGFYLWHRYAEWLLQPKLNPHPKYFVNISGNIEPHMPYPETLIFRATYAAYNPKCHIWLSRLAGVQGMRGHPDYYPVYPNTKGDYQIKIPIDKYLPGKCDWKIIWIMDAMPHHIPTNKNKWPYLAFGDVMDFGHYKNRNELVGMPTHKVNTLYCGPGPTFIACDGYEVTPNSTKENVLRNHSYTYIQNIKNKRRK